MMRWHAVRASVVLLSCLCCVALRAQFVISEFMTENDSTLADSDGEFSDWVEIYNRGATSASLDGWYLTDQDDELTRWRFPAVTLGPREYLVVFCSGNDRRDPAQDLHTNFRLRSDGEFLALVEPDGVEIAWEFGTGYPFQFADLSYGLRQDHTETSFVDENSDAKALVPSSNIGTSWRSVGFNDASWTSGQVGVGFDDSGDYDDLLGLELGNMRGTNRSAYVRIPFEASDVDTLDSLFLRMKYDDGFIAYLNGTEIARANAPASPQWNSGATEEHGEPEFGSMAQNFDDAGTAYVLTAHGEDVPPRVLTGGPDGDYLELTRDVGSLSNTVGFASSFGISQSINASFDFRMPTEASHTGCCGERADGFGFALIDTAVYGDSGAGPNVANIVWERPRFANAFTIGFDIFNGQGTENTMSVNWNGVEVASQLVSDFLLNNGDFNHCDVDVVYDESGALVTVTLVPDTFGAAGAPVTVFNNLRVPGMTPFESRVAFGARTGGAFVKVDLDNIEVLYSSSTSLELEAEEFDVSDHRDALVDGTNVLAIHGLNVSTNDEDFIVVPELEGVALGTLQTGSFRYFPEPTPGAVNSEGVAGFVRPVDFSQAAGGFFSTFDLSLSTNTNGATIRYTTNRSEPTQSSPEYTGPISMSSTTIVKAKAFRDDLLPSPTVTKTFMRLATDVRNFSSNLPIVVVDTFSQGIGDGSQTNVYAMFIDVAADGRARMLDTPDWDGSAGMKQRGSSSSGFAKKQWSFEAWDAIGNDEDVRILGYPKESDFILQGPYSDKSLMRNALAYQWSQDLGHYAVRTQFCEVFINFDGGTIRRSDLNGLYYFMEKIKRNEDRVNIRRLTRGMNTEPEITGGYIFKKDRLDPGDSGFRTGRGQTLAFVEPKERDISPAQRSYLLGYMNDFEAALYGGNFRHPTLGYRGFIDSRSWIDSHIMVEMTKNIDGYRLSSFFFKDREGKVVMGPVWDYNLSLGNANYLNGGVPQGWYYPQIDDNAYPYFGRLFQDPDFEQEYIDRWAKLRRKELTTERLLGDIDAAAAYIDEAQARNFQKWNILGSYVWPNAFIADTHAEEIAWMKNWLSTRLAWMDSQWLRPPVMNQDGGLIDPGFELSMTVPTGTIYYTLDGSDPRLPGGAINPAASALGSAAELPLVADALDNELRVLVPENGALGTTWTNRGFNDNAWLNVTTGHGVGYERGSGYEPFIDQDLEASMDGVNTSAYLRYAFDVADRDALISLVLRLRYDDGFVAYLNGSEVARANAPASLPYDAAATTLHDDGEAIAFQNFDITPFINRLIDGSNVLAIHGLNESVTSSDFLIEATLSGSTAFEGNSVVLDGPTQVVARTFENGEWSGLTREVFVLESDLPLRVSEIMYHPKDLPEDAPYSAADLEFIEFQNIGPVPVDLRGVLFTNGLEFEFANGEVDILDAGDFVVVVRNRAAFDWYYGDGIQVAGQFTGALDNSGETLEIMDGTGQAIQQFRFDDWFPETDGGGFSLVIRDVTDDPSVWALESGWEIGATLDGTPGSGDEVSGPRGFQTAGDANQDGVLDLSDGITLLRQLFDADDLETPCEGDLTSPGNLFVFDSNGDADVDISDASYLLAYLFLSGPPPSDGTGCQRVEGCPDACN